MEQEAGKTNSWKSQMNWTIFGLSSGFLFAFIIACLINKDITYRAVNICSKFVASYFGGGLQVMMIVFWFIAITIAFSKWGKIRIGGKDATREYENLSWYAIITTTMLAAGGVFFAAAEPLSHFLALPSHFSGIQSGAKEAVNYAMAQSFLHWGFLVWGPTALCVPLLLYARELKKLPLRPSSMLYPVLGEKGVRGMPGKLFDGLALIGVAAGTIGPTGFLGLQLSFALHDLWGMPDTVLTQMIIIAVATIMFILGASTGLKKGMDFLAKWTIYLSGVMLVGVMVFGKGLFVADSFINGYGIYLGNFFQTALSRVNVDWLSGWTIFYEAWFLSFGPSMAVLTLTLSRGRTLRQVLIGTTVICPILTNFWFSVFGGTTLALELQTPGLISDVFNQFGMPSVLLTVLHYIPLSAVWLPLAIVLVVLYLVTTGAGIAYTMSEQVTGMEVPYVWVRTMYCVLLGVTAALLVWIGGDSAMNTLQSFMVIGGVPLLIFYIILIPGVYKAAKAMYQSKKHRLDPDDGFVEEKPVGTVPAVSIGSSLASNQDTPR